MILLCICIIPIMYTCIKLILFFLVSKFGKFTYNGFKAFGFAYNKKDDLFYATKHAWQKKVGYSHLYDVGAPLFRMIIDTEAIHFSYNNKNWLISFWKGQYGITTGAEIGIYCTNDKNINKNTLYLPVDKSEMLDMHFMLYKKKEKLMEAKAKHWWLAIFKLGMFSKPKDLTMDIRITFPSLEMLEAFLIGLKKLGYKKKDYRIINTSFLFTYKKPRTKKVWTRCWLTDKIINSLNHNNVKRYNRYAKDLIDNEETSIKVQDFIPKILQNQEKEDFLSDKKEAENNINYFNKEIISNLGNDL